MSIETSGDRNVFGRGPLTRRALLSQGGLGVSSVALAWLLRQDKLLADVKTVAKTRESFDLKPRVPSVEPRARAMISLFMQGGPSQVDLLDPKPELGRLDGQTYGGKVVFSFFNRATKHLLGSPWKFKQHGKCGTPVSELLPHFSEIVDDVYHSAAYRFLCSNNRTLTWRLR